MASIDRMRVVELRNFQVYPILDLMTGANFTHIKGQFTTKRPSKTRAAVSGARRFDGDRIAFEKMGNASIVCQWMVNPPGGTQDAGMALLERMGQVFEDASTQGRLIEVRFAGTTRSVFYEPRGTPDWDLQAYDPLQVIANGVYQATATIPVGPLANGSPMDVQDDFQTDTVSNGDWLKDGAGAFSVVGTALAPAGTGAGNRMRYRHARGYAYRDGTEVRLTIRTGAVTTNGRWGIFICGRQDGVDTKLALEVDAASATYGIYSYVAGVRTTVTNNAFAVSANSLIYLRMLREGDNVRYLAQNDTIPPAFAVDDYTLTFWHTPTVLGNVAAYLGFQEGDCGIDITAADTGERYTSFAIRPYSYYSVGTPEVHRMSGVPGTAPALMDVELTTADAGAVGQPPVWADLAWSERPLISNLLNNGDFETAPGGLGDGWQHAALTNYITNAATSHTRDATASRYGGASLQIVTPASLASGASCTIYRRLKADRQYAAFCWAKSAAQTTTCALKLGGTGLLGSTTGPVAALSATWKLYSVLYRNVGGFGDNDGIVVAFATTAATATTMNIDGVCVVEVGTITLQAAIASTTTTTLQVYATNGEAPYQRPDGTISAPFLALIDQELIRVTAITPGFGFDTWTIERGAEFTTAATHTVDTPVIVVPVNRPQLEGKGAHPAFGIIEGESYAAEISTGGASSLAVSAGTNLRSSNAALVTWAAGSAPALYYYVDPSTIVPDDFTLGEVDVEIIARVFVPNGTTTSILTYAEPTERYNGLVLAGRRRYTREYGTTSKVLVTPSSAGEWRLTRLGTIPMVVDRTNPQRWRIRLTPVATVGGSTIYIDYLMLAPVRNRACLPTGKADDGGATYPSFFASDPNWGTGAALTKILRADGSALIRNPIPSSGRLNALPPAFPDHGLGKQILVAPGDNDFYLKISDTIPDDPTVNNVSDMSGGTSASWACTVRAMVTPRFYVGRGGA